MGKSIQIAPYADEISVSGNEMRTDFAGGIVYRAEGLNRYEENSLKECFSMAIALCSKRWQLEELLNRHLQLKGVIE